MRPEGAAREVPIFPVLLVNFIGALGYSLIFPFLIFLVTKMKGNALVYGLLGATYPAFQLIGAPLLGRWSDVYGRRKVLLLSQAGTALSWVVFSIALALPVTVVWKVDPGHGPGFLLTLPLVVLFAARALDGLTGGNVSVANAYLADVTSEDDRSANFGKMAVSSNLGYIVGPALAGLLGATALEESLPVFAALAISLAGTYVVAVHLLEPDPCASDPGPRRASLGKILGQEPRDCVKRAGDARWRDVLGLRGVPLMLALYFLTFLGFNFFYTAFPVHAASGLGWSILQIGAFFAVLSLLMVIVQGPVLARLSRRCSDVSLVIVGNLILGTNFLLIASEDWRLVSVGVLLFAVGNGLMWPSFLSILSKVAGDEHQGAVQGLAGACGSLAAIVGLVSGGLLYNTVGTTTFVVSAVTIYAVFLLSFALAPLGQRPR